MLWLELFFNVAEVMASKSKDPSTKVGCVIAGPDNEIRTSGYNGFPRGCDDSKHMNTREEKLMWTEHAERNAIYNAARCGISLIGCSAFVTSPPCVECTRALIQSGVRKIFYLVPGGHEFYGFMDRWKDSVNSSKAMCLECGVFLYFVQKHEGGYRNPVLHKPEDTGEMTDD